MGLRERDVALTLARCSPSPRSSCRSRPCSPTEVSLVRIRHAQGVAVGG